MAINAEQLNIILAARDKEFTKAMDRANRRVQAFASKSQKDLSNATKSFNSLGKAVKLLVPILAGAFSVRAISRIVDSAAAIKDASRVAGLSASQFQKMAFASKTVGIQQDKLADILKDVNDKLGDYLVTGAGPMADFFETVAPLVGITADAFRDLNSADALQLYVDSLQAANLSQAQMTFFMEAIASDATVLLPLLRDNGKEMGRLGDEAERAGRVMSDDAVDGAVKMREEFQKLTGTMETMIQQAILENADEIISLVQTFTDDILPKLVSLGADIAKYFGGGTGAVVSAGQAAIDRAADQAAFAQMDGGDMGSGQWYVDPKTGEPVNVMDMNVPNETAIRALEGGVLYDPSKPNKPTPTTKTITPTKTKDEADKSAAAAAKAIQKAKDAYDSLLGSLDPVSAAQMEYNKQLAVMDEYEKLTGKSIDNKAQIVGKLKLQLQDAKDEMSGMSDVASALESGLTSVFMSALEGAESFEDAIKNTAKAVISELYRVLVVQQLVNAAMGAFGFTRAPSGNFVRTNASGGTLQAGTPSLVGENGPELIVPSKGSRILSHADTMKAMGGGGNGVTVVQNINVSTGVQQTVRTEIKSLMPQIADSAKAAVLDAKRRGGSYGKAFT